MTEVKVERMREKVILSCLIICSLLLVSCSANETPPITGITVIDSIGREVVIPENIEKLGCLYAVTGHIATMLGDGEKIVAVSNGLHRDKLLLDICPAISNSIIVKSGGGINIEELLNTDPDVVFVDLQSANDESEMKKLDKVNIPWLAIDFDSLSELKKAVAIIGKVLKKEELANKYNEYLDTVQLTVNVALSDLPDNERVRVYHAVNEAVRTDAPNTLPAEWLAIAGVDNVSLSGDLRLFEDKYLTTLEQILYWNPEVIICNEDGVEEYILRSEQWQSITAVQNGSVYLMPNGISRWGHPTSIETPLAMLWTAKTLYPDYCTDIDLESMARDFYLEFFNYDITEDLLAQVLAGKDMRFDRTGEN